MGENENKDTNVKATIDAITGLVQAVPIYQDTLQPAAKQIGNSLETVTKTVNIALAPIKALVWGYEKIEEFISNRVAEKLKNIPPENITIPPTEIAGPAIEALRFSGEDINLRELYANLLAASMDINTKDFVHPGFVQIIKNLASEEAILLQAFIENNIYPLIDIKGELTDNSGAFTEYSNYSHLHKNIAIKKINQIPTYLNNLCRLGLIEIPQYIFLTAPNTYEPLENDIALNSIKTTIEGRGNAKVKFERKIVQLTSFGKQFLKNVVVEK